MDFLIVVQDLRISGTSEGIVSRSFLAKLRKVYPEAVIDVVYLKNHFNNDRLDLLPVNSIKEHYIQKKNPFIIKWINKFYWRIFNSSLNDIYHIYKYRKILKQLKYDSYDYIFIRSSGQDFETIRAGKDLPILKKAIINFHDPYPVFWDTGSKYSLNNLELYKLKEMWKVVQKAKICITPSKLLSEDLEHLYGSFKKFHTLPHQYDKDVFIKCEYNIAKKEKKLTISYQGAIQLGRNIDILLDGYRELLKENKNYIEQTEFVIRIRGNHTHRLIEKYKDSSNIKILGTLEFSHSSFEQAEQADILIILENCATHSNILVGKAPFLASLNKPILSLSPWRSEMREIIKKDEFIATCNDIEDVKRKLNKLIIKNLKMKPEERPFGDYFNEENFCMNLNKILSSNS